jgi:cytochrome c-type biogenesis protein CcsB
MEQLKKTASSYATMMVLMSIWAVALAVATFVEKAYGSTAAKVWFYYSPVFFLLQLLLVINLILIMMKRRLHRSGKWGLAMLHFSFIVILTGALVSHLTGKEGMMHLREGEKSHFLTVQTSRGQRVHRLPFEVELVKFTLRRYPGSVSPSSYESELRIYLDDTMHEALVYMNNVLDVKGYRFFQASYDRDERGTILSVNRDTFGRRITYAGYLLLLVGSLLCLFTRNGRIRTLYRLIKKRKTASGLFTLLLLSASTSFVAGREKPVNMRETIQQLSIAPLHAELFGSLPVQTSNGRMVPVNTFSSEILRKLSKDVRFFDLNSDQFLLSVLTYPEMWMFVPLIKLPDRDFEHYFRLTPDRCAYIDLFESDGSYKLQERVEEAYRKMPTERTSFDKDLIRLDERVNILHQLLGARLICLFPKPDDPEGKWYAPGDDFSSFASSDSAFILSAFADYLTTVRAAVQSQNWDEADEKLKRIRAYQYEHNNVPEMTADQIELELKYNRMDIFRRCKIGYLSLGGLLLLLSFAFIFREGRWIRWLIRLVGIAVLIVFHYQMLGMGMRWRIGGYAPWSNSYETMVYAAWATVFAGLMFVRRSPVTFALATVFAGVILFVSSLSWMDPQINPLVPVLKSPWLMFHVAIIMSAYGFFGISFLIGLTSLGVMSVCSRERLCSRYADSLRELRMINEISLIVGLLLMTIGTFMGAVWANESWGRYWGWDPKETWALITILAYVLVTHLHLIGKWNDLWRFNLCAVFAFASVLMTYFGVNYFLSGLHAYGQNDELYSLPTYLYAAGGLLLVVAFLARKGRRVR